MLLIKRSNSNEKDVSLLNSSALSLSSVQIDQDGKKAILQLANGDMRRALNILQVKKKTTTMVLFVC